MADLSSRYEQRLREIRQEEHERYLEAAAPKLRDYTYDRPFAATLRHVAGAEKGLWRLQRDARDADASRQQLAQLQRRYARCQAEYNEEKREAMTAYKNAKIRAAVNPDRRAPSQFQPTAEMRRLAAQLRSDGDQIARLQSELGALDRQFRQWRKREKRLRNQEQRELKQLLEGRDSRIKARTKALWQEPWAEYVYVRKSLETRMAEREEVIETKRQLLKMLQDEGRETDNVEEDITSLERVRERLAKELEERTEEFMSEHYPDAV
ncbi:MAG: hypothetical protein PVJ27_05965 [Candidatus Brocadiaceae bacterium]